MMLGVGFEKKCFYLVWEFFLCSSFLRVFIRTGIGCQAVDGEAFGSSGGRTSSALIGRPGAV